MEYKNNTNELLSIIIIFQIGLVISTIMIYIATKLPVQKEGIGKTFFTTLIGRIIYFVMHLIIRTDS